MHLHLRKSFIAKCAVYTIKSDQMQFDKNTTKTKTSKNNTHTHLNTKKKCTMDFFDNVFYVHSVSDNIPNINVLHTQRQTQKKDRRRKKNLFNSGNSIERNFYILLYYVWRKCQKLCTNIVYVHTQKT